MAALLLAVAALPLAVLADSCGTNKVPFGFEAHKNGHVNLLCSRPNCFEKKYADCDERPQRTSCTGNNTWVGGIERTVDGKLYLQCCEFAPLAIYGEKLFDNVKVRVGEYFEGEEKTEEGDDWVVYFDLISNIRVIRPQHPKKAAGAVYELTVHRYHCGREPDDPPTWRITPPWPWRIPPVDVTDNEEKSPDNQLSPPCMAGVSSHRLLFYPLRHQRRFFSVARASQVIPPKESSFFPSAPSQASPFRVPPIQASRLTGSRRSRRMAAAIAADQGEEVEAEWAVWKDRTADTNDLKRTFSRVRSDSPIPADVVTRAHFLCAQYLGGAWKTASSKQFSIKQITGGMSNLLFLVSLCPSHPLEGAEPRRALLRVHCQTDIDQLLSESVVFTLLSERSLGPKLLGVFPGGRFEQFIPSRPLACEEISQDRLITRIAPMLARVHSLHVPIGKEPQIINRARGWLAKWMGMAAAVDGVSLYCTQSNLHPSQFPAHVSGEQLMSELDYVERFLDAINSPILFSHNDLQEGNILLVDREERQSETEDELVLIDFEYCDYNFRGFDLGNHMCEYGYDYSWPEHPYYQVYQERFNAKEKRRLFSETYLDELYALRRKGVSMPSDMATGDRELDLASIEREALLFMPISNLFWSCWALLNAEESSIAFGYAEYARDRLALYFDGKKGIDEFMRNTHPSSPSSLSPS